MVLSEMITFLKHDQPTFYLVLPIYTGLQYIYHNNNKEAKHFEVVKGALSGLKQILATESPLKMIKNGFYFTFKGLFVLKIFKFLSRFFGLVGKRLD